MASGLINVFFNAEIFRAAPAIPGSFVRFFAGFAHRDPPPDSAQRRKLLANLGNLGLCLTDFSRQLVFSWSPG